MPSANANATETFVAGQKLVAVTLPALKISAPLFLTRSVAHLVSPPIVFNTLHTCYINLKLVLILNKFFSMPGRLQHLLSGHSQ